MQKEKLEKRKKVMLDLMSDPLYVPMKIKEIAIFLDIPKSKRASLQEVLDVLIEEGKIEVSKKGKYRKAPKKSLKKSAARVFADDDKSNGKYVTGVYTAHPKGFGFATVEDEEDDYFIPGKYANHAFHHDTVKIEVLPAPEGKRAEGRVVEIISHEIENVVGTYQKSNNFGFVVCDNTKLNTDIFIPQGKDMRAVSGHKVVCRITNYGNDKKKPEGVIIEILGHENDPGTDILSIIRSYELPTEFPEKVMTQAQKMATEVTEADMKGRMDLRDVTMVTIDGEDAKDLDDAISLSKEGDKYILGVHIADVSNYVQENSALDIEALKRGTSVYLVDRVIPMLPHTLSNGMCSLNQGENRLALSCIMTIDHMGKIVDHTIAETVVKIDRRMSYTSVKKILVDWDPDEMLEYNELISMFELMQELSGIIRKRRMKRGSIDFDFPETKIILDKNGRPIDIKPYERNIATKIIEDFMLVANETVAEDFCWKEVPFLYRTHATPDGEKIRKLATFIGNFGFTMKGNSDDIHPKEMQKLLGQIEGSPQEDLISRLTLRSMQQAKYTVECTGHFGLAAEYYCHFTSPIRRYPDLQIHRIIKESLRGKLDDKRQKHYESILPTVATQTSKLERRADESEREVEKLKKVEFMEEHVGETFTGVVSSVTAWGMYVELSNTVEGLIHITKLRDDYYHFVEETYELVGEANNKHYKLGQPITVRVDSVDKMARTIDFEIGEDENEQRNKKTHCK